MMEIPTLHNPVPMNTRVIVPEYYHSSSEDVVGTVGGIASVHVIFQYIVILDKPLETAFGYVNAVVVNGPELVGVQNENWKIENQDFDIVAEVNCFVDSNLNTLSLLKGTDQDPMKLTRNASDVEDYGSSNQFGAISSRLKSVAHLDIGSKQIQSGVLSLQGFQLELTVDKSSILLERS